MSDHLYVAETKDWTGTQNEETRMRVASVDEVLVHVRRGVESGEIEGEVRKSIVTVDPEDGGEAFYVRVPHDGYWLMIPAGGATNGPVSDGGSET